MHSMQENFTDQTSQRKVNPPRNKAVRIKNTREKEHKKRHTDHSPKNPDKQYLNAHNNYTIFTRFL